MTIISMNVSGEFLRIVKRRLHSLLLTQDGNTFSPIKSNWVIKEASNIDALQEGGTFRSVKCICLSFDHSISLQGI